jgi:hypothetical protein
VFPKAPVWTDKAIVKIRGGGSNRITIRKMFNGIDAEGKNLTDKLSAANIL